jgi:tetratricopeptide (TPR) repeat protein
MGQDFRRMNLRFASCLLWLLSLAAPVAWAGEEPWKEVRSQHFRVLTNGTVQDATKVVLEFEQLRWLFSTRFLGMRLDSGAPLLIVAVRDQATARALEPELRGGASERIAGLFHHGWEKQFAMVRLDTFGGNGARVVVYHEYTHTILHMNWRWLPTWLDEGTAEFYAYTRFDEHKIYVGAPTVRVRVLHSARPNSIEEIMAVTQRSPLYSSEFFYAESWALVHFLVYAPEMQGGKKLGNFLALLQQGMEQRKAFRQVFGEPKELDKAFTAYTWVGQTTHGDGTVGQAFAATALKDNPQISEKDFVVRTTSLAETEAELGSYHLWIHDLTGARSLIEKALEGDPKLGLAHESLGFLDFSDGKDAEAAAEFSQAFALNGNLYLSLFNRTMLSSMATSNKVDDMNALGRALGKVLQLNPDFAPAYVQLARLALREGDIQSALAVAQRAEALEPSRAGYHVFTGKIQRRMGKGGDAAAAALYVADRWFGPDRDEAVELWNSVPADQRPAGESIVEMMPPDTQTAEGSVKAVSCAEQEPGWAFVLNHDGQPLTFHRKGGFTSGYSDSLWFGGDHFSLCHHLEGLRAVVRYKKPADPTYAGDVAEIEIRDDLPEPVKLAAAPVHP